MKLLGRDVVLNKKRIAFVFGIQNHFNSLMNSTKKIILGVLVCFGTAAMLKAAGTNQLTDEKSRVSYAIGMMLGQKWQQEGLAVDPDQFAAALKAVQSGGKTLLTPEEMKKTLMDFQKKFAAERMRRRQAMAAKNKQEGEAFLAANKKKPGVQTLPDGLQYQVITNGTGPIPGPKDTVTVNYRGMLINGKVFDSSYKRGHPATFPVNGVIHGWTQALEKMHVGSKWKLFIPANLAYGERGGRGIPPNATLIFDVELLNTKSPTPPKAAAPLTSDIIKVPSAAQMKKGAKIQVIKAADAAKAEKGASK